MKRIVVMVAVGLLGCVGCGDKSPAEKCDDLVSRVCDRAVECISGASGMHDDCVHAFDQEMLCANTKSVGPMYDRCMAQLDAESCQSLFPRDPNTGAQVILLPTDCESVLSTQPARREVDPGVRVSTPLDDAIQSAEAQIRE